MSRSRAAVVLAIALGAAYIADAGHGFIKDDFRWVRETRLDSLAELPRLISRTDGFYRPIVSVSFALVSGVAGPSPRAHGLANVALLFAAAALVWVLGLRLGLSSSAALVAAGAWAFNFHGINMAVLWISGRTSLLVTIGALLAAIASIGGRMWLAGVACLFALFAKEEAILLPVVIAAWRAYDVQGGIARRALEALRNTWPCFAALAAYLILRARTDAFWPADAPAYYRLTFSPLLVGENILHYADRAATVPLVISLLLFAASGWRARLNVLETRIVVFGAIWLACSFALTVVVPVRSSLYAVLPSVGSALAAGAMASAAVRAMPARVGMAFTALTLLPLLLLPIYWRRNERWVKLADLSTAVLNDVCGKHRQGAKVVLIDDPDERFNLEAAFGNLWHDAAALCEPRLADAAVVHERPPSTDAIVLRLASGKLKVESEK